MFLSYLRGRQRLFGMRFHVMEGKIEKLSKMLNLLYMGDL